MSNKILLDTSILVEYRKGKKEELFLALAADTRFSLCISQAILSEVLFFHLKIFGGKSPLSVKMSGSIAKTLDKYGADKFLAVFSWLNDFPELPSSTFDLMKKHNLLPNDASILATAIHHKVAAIASHDSDFALPCRQENITLLTSAKDFRKLQKPLGG